MSYGEYEKALALGQKEYKACRARDISPYPPVLDEVLEGKECRGEVNLGLLDRRAAAGLLPQLLPPAGGGFGAGYQVVHPL